MLCASVRRFASFNPVGVMVVPGPPGDDPAQTRRMVVEGVKAAADVAGELGVTIGFEQIRKDAGSINWTLPQTLDILEDIGSPDIKIIFDTWHFWDLPNVSTICTNTQDRFICIQVTTTGATPQLGRQVAPRGRRISTCRPFSGRWRAAASRAGTN